MQELKKLAAIKALDFVEDNSIVGIGSGSTVAEFIDVLSKIKHRIAGCVASSSVSEKLLKSVGIQVFDLNVVDSVPLIVDGADEVNANYAMIKGGGGALTREKILANVAEKFVCIVDESKFVKRLGDFPVAVEVIPMARGLVGRKLLSLGGNPQYRQNFVTDNGNIIIDVYGLDLSDIKKMEDLINCIPGVVENGIFAHRLADSLIVSGKQGIKEYHSGSVKI
ncbi:MAG: ribose 5-phosphate isomerase A [Legionellales bacterium RIFCSPHIGHO2_12_FULL_35_11]|nr:MAG: ribose 5-phosphate isomerase A [Legionellales bacterium RIFCSPHIGHO2_12_FULL_35_11]